MKESGAVSLPLKVSKGLMAPEQIRQVREMLNSQAMRYFQEHAASVAAEYCGDLANLMVNTDPEDENAVYQIRELQLAATMITRMNDFIDRSRGEEYEFSSTVIEPKPQAVITSTP